MLAGAHHGRNHLVRVGELLPKHALDDVLHLGDYTIPHRRGMRAVQPEIVRQLVAHLDLGKQVLEAGIRESLRHKFVWVRKRVAVALVHIRIGRQLLRGLAHHGPDDFLRHRAVLDSVVHGAVHGLVENNMRYMRWVLRLVGVNINSWTIAVVDVHTARVADIAA
ncbi:hypothetical protein KXX11_004428, partial [Aspergillus fumigatus]